MQAQRDGLGASGSTSTSASPSCCPEVRAGAWHSFTDPEDARTRRNGLCCARSFNAVGVRSGQTGYEEPIRSREGRARALEHADHAFIRSFTDERQGVVAALLDRYRISGVDEISTAEVFNAPPFSTDLGGIRQLVMLFGGAAPVSDMLHGLQQHLYTTPRAA